MKLPLTLCLSVGVLFLLGCKSTQPLYYHGSYNANVYQYFTSESASIEQQIADLHQTIERANGESLPVAPGTYAHLGYLYIKAGDMQSGLTYLNDEKSMYPESKRYIDFLINNIAGSPNE